MALQKTVTTSHGFVSQDAYHKVDNIKIFSKSSMTFDIKILKSKNETIAFDTLSFQCMYELDKENPIKQAYLYLKTRSEFVDSTDC
tara:strand:- start:618 stop:875 length:258 start_codon:yes stop_codon:yes gene_type:complete